MSDKTVGIIGQTYEDRKTGKRGVLESRDDKYKTLMFKAEDGSTFSITNSSFRSNWRKTKEENVETNTPDVKEEVTEPVEEVKEEKTESEVKPRKRAKTEKKSVESTPTKSYEGVTKEDALANFVETIMTSRDVKVLNVVEKTLEIFVDDSIVIRIKDNEDGTYNLMMLPDVFTLSDWRGILNTVSIEYKVGAEDYLGIIVDTKQSCIPEILDIIVDAVRDINLYGYTLEESDCEEESNAENN